MIKSHAQRSEQVLGGTTLNDIPFCIGSERRRFCHGSSIIAQKPIRISNGPARLEWASLSGRDSLVEREDLRHHLGYYLLLGLEFLIAADIVHTVLTPTLADLAILGAIVAIRTVISFSINWELRQVSRHEVGGGKST